MQQSPFNSSGAEVGIDEDMISTLVDRFYAAVRLDPLIGPVFEARVEDWDAHLVKLKAFWSAVVLRTGRYRGSPMPVHVAIDEISSKHFERWLELFAETAREVCPPDAAALFVDRSHRIGQSLQLGISLHREDGMAFQSPARSA
jgi:hemoglobin